MVAYGIQCYCDQYACLSSVGYRVTLVSSMALKFNWDSM